MSKQPGTHARLSLQQKIFCEKYVGMGVLVNAVKAAVLAGYKVPHVSAPALLKKPEVQAYIDQLRYETRLRNNITIDDIINELAKIAFADIRELYDEENKLKDIKDMDDICAAAIKDFEVEKRYMSGDSDDMMNIETTKVRRYDKLNALNALRECLGFKQREMTIKRDAQGKIIETEETVDPDVNKVVFEDNSGETSIDEEAD